MLQMHYNGTKLTPPTSSSLS